MDLLGYPPKGPHVEILIAWEDEGLNVMYYPLNGPEDTWAKQVGAIKLLIKTKTGLTPKVAIHKN